MPELQLWRDVLILTPGLRRLSNEEPARALEEHLWADMPLLDPRTSLLSEALDRLLGGNCPMEGEE